MRKVVGISQKIKRAWLDAFLDRLAQTNDETELRSFLDSHLKEELPGKEGRVKTCGIIVRIWCGVPPERVALRDRGIALLPRISGQERIWLHWGMTALAYPFFRDVAEVVGRLLTLQDDFTLAQMQARMVTAWGDRATSTDAVKKVIATLVDWEVLRSTKTRGHYLLARKMTASVPDVQLWLLDAMLAANAADEIAAQQLLRLPELFPFSVTVGIADLRKHEDFIIHRQGLDVDMVAPRPVKVEQPASKPRGRARQGRAKRREPIETVSATRGGEAAESPRALKKSSLPVRSKAARPVQHGLFDKEVDEPASGTDGGGAKAVRRVHGTVSLDPSNMERDAGKVANEVVRHLASLGSRLDITLEIRAEIPDDVPEKVVRDMVKRLNTPRFKSQAFEEQ